MRFRNYIFIFILFVSTIGVAQDFSGLGNTKVFDSRFVSEHFSNVYKVNPSMLCNWKYSDWSFIGANYDYEKGNFRDLQSYNRLSNFSIKTESIKKFSEKGWTFYGMFSYSNGSLDSVHNNLTLTQSLNGSPYYLLLRMPGQWKTQHYIFNAIAAKNINDRLSLGLRIFYDGDLAFRQNDTRNSQTTLSNHVSLSSSYRLFSSHTVSLGVSYKRSKSEPSLSNKFQHESSDLMYNRYLNAGLGSYIKNMTYRDVLLFDKTYGLSGQWFYRNVSNEYSVAVDGDLGEDYVIDKAVVNVEDQNKILKYNYKKAIVTASALNSISNGHIHSVLKGFVIKGTGNIFNETSKVYVDNYISDIYNVSLNSSFVRTSSFLNAVSLVLGAHKEIRFDKNFGYLFKWFNVNAGANIRLSTNIKAANLMLSLGALYTKNLDFTHNPNAASDNIYTKWIGNPRISWQTTDYIEVPVSLTCKLPIKANLIELSVNGGVLIPQKVNYAVSSGFTINDNFFYINNSIKFYF